jgi:large exoprotein involved in heme utilization and adhesion
MNATGPVTIADQGSGLFTTTVSNGVGGNIKVVGSGIHLSNGASISATSSGSGNAGNISINAGNQLAMTNSSVTTEANQASGGTIKIITSPTGTVQLMDSTISASVLDGTGGGGSVNIDPQFVLLQNSQILANAVFGLGGNINLTTNLLLPDSASIISASSQFGQQGTISIQSPISPASGKIIPLSQKPLIETSLMGQRCAASAEGIYSSFTVAGRDSLPAEPGSWISSPLALTNTELVGGAVSEKDSHTSLSEPTGEMAILSLRRIAPRGFLAQSFAVDSSGGCSS